MLSLRSRGKIPAAFFCLPIVFVLGVQSAAAEEEAVILINDGNQAVSDSAWTDEDFENAQPMMLTVDPNSVDPGEIIPADGAWTADDFGNAQPLMPTADPDAKPDKPSIGPPPSRGLDQGVYDFVLQESDPNAWVPFAEQPTGTSDGVIEPSQAGTQAAYFSSQRLLPRDAAMSWPYRLVGKLFFKNKAGASFVCSASIIQRRLLVTAGHCVHSGNRSGTGWYNSFVFIPAYGATYDGQAPWGQWKWSRVVVSGEWYRGGGTVPNSDDYAMIEIRDQAYPGLTTKRRIGQVLGWFGWITNYLHPNHVHSLGYPCNMDSCRQMHQVTAESWRLVAPNNVTYGSDMRGGSSGGPLVQNLGSSTNTATTGTARAQRNRVLGVISWGYISTGPQVQGASNFDATFVRMWNSACGWQKGNCSS